TEAVTHRLHHFDGISLEACARRRQVGTGLALFGMVLVGMGITTFALKSRGWTHIPKGLAPSLAIIGLVSAMGGVWWRHRSLPAAALRRELQREGGDAGQQWERELTQAETALSDEHFEYEIDRLGYVMKSIGLPTVNGQWSRLLALVFQRAES